MSSVFIKMSLVTVFSHICNWFEFNMQFLVSKLVFLYNVEKLDLFSPKKLCSTLKCIFDLKSWLAYSSSWASPIRIKIENRKNYSYSCPRRSNVSYEKFMGSISFISDLKIQIWLHNNKKYFFNFCDFWWFCAKIERKYWFPSNLQKSTENYNKQ